MGLDTVFSTIKMHIVASKPTPTLGTAYHLVVKDEQQRTVSATRRQGGSCFPNIHESTSMVIFRITEQ